MSLAMTGGGAAAGCGPVAVGVAAAGGGPGAGAMCGAERECRHPQILISVSVVLVTVTVTVTRSRRAAVGDLGAGGAETVRGDQLLPTSSLARGQDTILMWTVPPVMRMMRKITRHLGGLAIQSMRGSGLKQEQMLVQRFLISSLLRTQQEPRLLETWRLPTRPGDSSHLMTSFRI